MASKDLSAINVIVIAASLAVVGGATIYYIKKSKERALPLDAPGPVPLPQAQTLATPKQVPHHAAPHVPRFGSPAARPASAPARAPSASPLSQAAAQFRTSRQQNVDDVTVLRSAAINPSLSDAQRDFARHVLEQAGIRLPPPHRQAPPHAWPAEPPQADDGSHPFPATPYDTPVSSPPAHHTLPPQHPLPPPVHYTPTPEVPPVHYTPAPMPMATQAPASPAHSSTSDSTAHGPTYWTDVVQRLGLVKPGDRLLTIGEAQHYLNVIGGFPHLAEDSIDGPQTQHALEAFQLAHHLPMTGKIDHETSSALIYGVFTAATPQFVAPGF